MDWTAPIGSFRNPVCCHAVAEEFGLPDEHCETCHGNNIFDEDVCHDVVLADGRHAEVCCEVKKALENAPVPVIKECR